MSHHLSGMIAMMVIFYAVVAMIVAGVVSLIVWLLGGPALTVFLSITVTLVVIFGILYFSAV